VRTIQPDHGAARVSSRNQQVIVVFGVRETGLTGYLRVDVAIVTIITI